MLEVDMLEVRLMVLLRVLLKVQLQVQELVSLEGLKLGEKFDENVDVCCL